MYLPVLQAINTSEIYISGDVTIDSTAVISPGVILQAAPGSKIIIRAGACIGLGAILKAYGGKIEVKENAILGAGVLVIGESQINSQVCIGALTTVYNTSLESMSMIAPGSVLGDPTRSLETSSTNNQKAYFQSSNTSKPIQKDLETRQDLERLEKNEDEQPFVPTIKSEIKEEETTLIEEIFTTETKEFQSNFEEDLPVTQSSQNTSTEDLWENTVKNSPQNPIVGKVYINKLLFTLFPERQLKDT